MRPDCKCAAASVLLTDSIIFIPQEINSDSVVAMLPVLISVIKIIILTLYLNDFNHNIILTS